MKYLFGGGYFLLLGRSFFSLFFLLLITFYPSSSQAALTLSGRLNLNSATAKELTLLPEIGEVRAKAIESYRREKGAFGRIEDILAVSGIGEKTFAAVKPYVKISGESDLAISGALTPSLNKSKDESGDAVSLLSNDIFFRELIEQIKASGKSIVISMFLFKTSQYPSNYANRVLAALGDAAARGLKVSVLLERGKDERDSVTSANRATAAKMTSMGIEVRFDGPDKTTHTKIAVFDETTVILGSHNLTHSAMKYNNEVSLMLKSPELAKKLLNYIEALN